MGRGQELEDEVRLERVAGASATKSERESNRTTHWRFQEKEGELWEREVSSVVLRYVDV